MRFDHIVYKSAFRCNERICKAIPKFIYFLPVNGFFI